MTYPNPTPNDDEELTGFPGNFRKTLPHVETSGGLLDNDHYDSFLKELWKLERGESASLDTIPAGDPASEAKLVSPRAGASTETHGPDPQALEMRPAPGFRSLSTAAEMVELYWMALLRDKPIAAFLDGGSTDPQIASAVADIKAAFGKALDSDTSPGALKRGEDLPTDGNGALDIRPQTLFRCGLPDEQYGPLISQFFIRDIPYGTQLIDQSQVPYKAGLDFLTTWDDWYRAQHAGTDCYGRSYGNCNFYEDRNHPTKPVEYYATNSQGQIDRRMISTLRDLARFVNRDALHQAYFNAALFLDAVGAPLDVGNPYLNGQALSPRETGFATLGGPDLLTLVSEVASRALKVVWRQKWFVHRRARPEVYGGLLHAQEIGVEGTKTPYELPYLARDSSGGQEVLRRIGGYFLPIAFSAGSPVHPAYGAGHATVAGACVTVLKAWFDEDMKIKELFKNANEPKKHKEPLPSSTFKHEILVPPTNPEAFGEPVKYEDKGGDHERMTVGGELNKLASNVAMGRSMGGVHWRSDNTRSLRLGERVAIEILRKRTLEYAEPNVSFAFTSFDGKAVKIQGGKVHTS